MLIITDDGKQLLTERREAGFENLASAITERLNDAERAQLSQGVRVLILTTFDLDDDVCAALRAGASGFLLKDSPPADLLAAIRVIAAGDALLAPGVTRRLMASSPAARNQASSRATWRASSHREREVLILIARGLSNAEIAYALHVTMATAKTHVGRLLAKLGARDRAQLVMMAYETGLVQAG